MDFLDLISNINFIGVGSIILTVLSIIFILIVYVCKSVGIYLLSLRTKQKHTWMAFVPILQDIKVFNMAGLSTKVYVIFYCLYRALYSAKLEWGILAPIWWLGVAVYAVGLLYARYQMAKNFGESQLVCILNAIFEPFVLLYIVYKKHTHQYTPQYPKVDTYLKAYGLYEDPSTFEDPNAKPEPTFNKPKQQAQPQYQQPQNGWNANNGQMPNQWANPNQNPYTYQNQNPVQINVEKENNPLNLNTDK